MKEVLCQTLVTPVGSASADCEGEAELNALSS